MNKQSFEPRSGIKSNMASVMDVAHILPVHKNRWETKRKNTREQSHAANIRAHKQIFELARGKYETPSKRVLVMRPCGRGKFTLVAQGGVIVKSTKEAAIYGSEHGYTHLKSTNSDKLTFIRYEAEQKNN